MTDTSGTPPPALEFGFTFDVGLNLSTGDITNVARIQYRRPGERGWNRFLLIGDQGETFWSLSQKVEPAIRARAEMA